MMEVLKRAHDHKGISFVEIYQNCNVYNDGAFSDITGKDRRADYLIPLVHGEAVRYGKDGEYGVARGNDGHLHLVRVDEVGEDALLIHDESLDDPSQAFELSRLAGGPHEPTPIGIFRSVERPEYGSEVARQVAEVEGKKGVGNIAALLGSSGTWTVS